MKRIFIILSAMLISFGVYAEENNSKECGAVTTYHFGKTSSHIYPALILKVNKRKEIKDLDLNQQLRVKRKQNIKLEPGQHVLELIHLIDNRRLTRLHYNKQNYVKRLKINVEPGKVYYIAAKAEWPVGKVRNYWEPIVWKTKPKKCFYKEGDYVRKALKPAAKKGGSSQENEASNPSTSSNAGSQAEVLPLKTEGDSKLRFKEPSLYSSDVLPRSLAARLNQVLQEAYSYLRNSESPSGDNSKSFILTQAAKNIVRLGVLFDWRYSSETDGVKILGVSPGSLGQDMGLKTGDVIVTFDGQRLTEFGKTDDDFSEAAIRLFELAQNLKAGEKLQLDIVRQAETISVNHQITDEFIPAYQLIIGTEARLNQ